MGKLNGSQKKMENMSLGKGAKMKKLKHSRKILVLLTFIFIFVFSSLTVYAYDWNAPHPDVNTGSDVNEVKSTVWNALRSEGYSEESTAGIMGNIYAESGYNVNAIESGRSWSYSCYSSDTIGLGICQWSSVGRKDLLGSVCDENGVQWTDLTSQVQTLILELEDPYWISLSQYGYHFDTLDDFKNSTDIEQCTGAFCYNWERPNYIYAHFDTRLEEAQRVYEEFQGTPISNTSNSNSGDSESTNESLGLPEEWDLVGMENLRSKLAEQQQSISLADRTGLTLSEGYSTQVIGDNIVLANQANVLSTARVAVVFIGLCMVFYAVMLLLAYMFDRVNSFIDISLVKIATFGYLEYTDEDLGGRQVGKASSGRLIFLACSLMVIGCLFVSGGVIPFIMQIVFNLLEKFL